MVDVGAMIGDWRCRRFAAALVDYDDGALSAAERARVDRHLACCPRCAAAAEALAEVPVTLRGAATPGDQAFWAAQRRAVMDRIDAAGAPPERPPLQGFDWRLALPVAAAAVIALAGYLSLRPPSAPVTEVLDALSPADLATLTQVAADIMPEEDLLPDADPSTRDAVEGAIEAGWIQADGPPAWGTLDADDLETLHGIVG
jgi:anti-sigma factor RsiW